MFLFCDFCCGVLALLSTIVSVHTHHMYTLYTYIHVQNKEINAHITKSSRRLRPEGLYSYGETLGGGAPEVVSFEVLSRGSGAPRLTEWLTKREIPRVSH